MRGKKCKYVQATAGMQREREKEEREMTRKSCRMRLLCIRACVYTYICMYTKGRSLRAPPIKSRVTALFSFVAFSFSALCSHYRARTANWRFRLQLDRSPYHADFSLYIHIIHTRFTWRTSRDSLSTLASCARFDWPPSTARRTPYCDRDRIRSVEWNSRSQEWRHWKILLAHPVWYTIFAVRCH